ncbi:DUF1183-domain-containing protein [Panus rudis PR-1116 ss-1]|nr:DUF1183-domain-containing protein [Panus rudis PR-1116 ss-1]
MSKVALDRIRSLTFYKDAKTRSRRGKPIPQLTCIGDACRLYTPDVVRCENVGGYGTDVDWKCEADLPEALRFGRVEVSCEGWSGPGDPYVMKESCGLEYRLVRVPDSLRRPENHSLPGRFSRLYNSALTDPASSAFMLLWTALFIYLLYRFLMRCLGAASRGRPSNGPRPPGNPYTGGSWGWPWSNDPSPPHDPPPPYKRYDDSSNTRNIGGDVWRPGFWTGAALGGLGAYLFNNRQNERNRAYDWEREQPFIRNRRSPPFVPQRATGYGWRSAFSEDDRGEGSSNLGPMRSSVGLGGSNVR